MRERKKEEKIEDKKQENNKKSYTVWCPVKLIEDIKNYTGDRSRQ